MDEFVFHKIGTIRNDYRTKFGIPRQSVPDIGTVGKILFEPAYHDPAWLKGIDGFSHLWLLWYFSENKNRDKPVTPTVRPPRLGGNTRMGVFATRSPYRPNPIGLSCVLSDGVKTEQGKPVLYVRGADLLDGTPILDIKPYLPFADSYPDASCGFAEAVKDDKLVVSVSENMLSVIQSEKRQSLIRMLEQDPRPHYQADGRIYSFEWAGFRIRFSVDKNVLTVHDIIRYEQP